MNNFYFLDTYALFELIFGNKNYSKFKDSLAVTSIFNLVELNYNLKKDFSKKDADRLTKEYSSIIENIEVIDVINASDLKSKNRKLSLPGCVGYVLAKRIGAKFLTGDEGFRNMKNVEFVK
jgi:uncharacterized protein